MQSTVTRPGCPSCLLLQRGPATGRALRLRYSRPSITAASFCSWRQHGRERTGVPCRASNKNKAQEAVIPPRPSPQFSRQDLKRIKEQGPSIEDLVHEHQYQYKDNKGETQTVEYTFVPHEVLGHSKYKPEPDWMKLPQMSYGEFYQGLRERNWTSPSYREGAEPWSLEFFKDAGRFMRPSFTGYRAVVGSADGTTRWVNLPDAGNETFLQDHLAGGSAGGIWRAKRTPQANVTPYQYGYNQVFEQIFESYEQKVPPAQAKEMEAQSWVTTERYGYSCPGDRLVDVSWHLTANEFTLAPFYERLPGYLFFGFAFSFLGICIMIGLFKPKKQMPNDPIQAMEFAQSKGKARKEGLTDTKFADVAGIDTSLKEVQELVEFLKAPKAYSRLAAKPPKGVLLYGPPGVGKTLLAKAIAGEAAVPFYQMAGSEFVEIIVGVGAARVRDLFKRARVNAPCIIFVDEIDALGCKRAEAGVKANEEREQTLNQLLTEMDGFTPDIGVVFIAATNRDDLLDPALTRAGRFDKRIQLKLPDTAGRYAVLQVHARGRPLEGVDLYQVATDLPGLSGAELANVLNEAALEAIRRNGKTITTVDIYNAIDRILQGVRRPPLPDRMPIKRSFAVHEVGKALMATVLRQRAEVPRLEKIERISLVPRGRDWSRTSFMRGKDEDYTLSTRARLLERIQVTVAGRAAEEVFQENISTYSRNDLLDATRLAEKLVANYGLSEAGITTFAPNSRSVGYMRRSFEVAVDNIDADLFGKEVRAAMFQPSDAQVHKIRTATYAIVQEAYAEALEILEAHREAVNALTDELLAKETLTGDDVVAIMEAHPPKSLEVAAGVR